MVGRIEAYMHSDTITPYKGGSIVKVETQTDFAAKTQDFLAFALRAAKFAYAANSEVWDEVIKMFPDMETERTNLERSLKETISVSEIRILKL